MILWTPVSLVSFIPLVRHTGWDILSDIVSLPLVAWFVAVEIERSRRTAWQRHRTVQAQMTELERVQTAREEEQRRNERLRELKQEQDRFLAAMSHELKTPLCGMIGMLHVAKLEHLAQRDAMHINKCVNKALTCGKLLSFLVDDLLDCTRLSTDNFRAVPSTISIVELARSVLDLADHLNKHELDVRMEVDTEDADAPPWVRLDANRTLQARAVPILPPAPAPEPPAPGACASRPSASAARPHRCSSTS